MATHTPTDDPRAERSGTESWQVEVDIHRCIGTGVCVVLAPDALTRSGRRTSPRSPVVPASEAVLDAAESCPVEALLVRDAATGQILAPAE